MTESRLYKQMGIEQDKVINYVKHSAPKKYVNQRIIMLKNYKINEFENNLIDKFCLIVNIDRETLFSKSRLSSLVFRRSVLMYILHYKCGLSTSKSAIIMGGRDHSTLIHAMAKFHRIMSLGLSGDASDRREANRILAEMGYSYTI